MAGGGTTRVIAAIICGLFGGAVQAQTPVPAAIFDYAVGVNAEAHTNVSRTEAGGSELSLAPFGRFRFEYHSPRIDLNASGSTEYVLHLDDTFDDEFQNKLSAEGVFRILEDRLHWVLDEEMDVFTVDPLAADNIDNRQELNVFSTGPDLIFMPGRSDKIVIGARWVDFRSEANDSDNRQQRAEAEWTHNFSDYRNFGIVLGEADVEFDTRVPNDDFTRSDAALKFEEIRRGRGATDSFEIVAGETEINFEDTGRQTETAPLVHLRYRRNWAEQQWLRLTARRELSDISREVQSASLLGIGQSALSIAVTRDPFDRDRVDLEGFRRWTRQDLRLTLFYDDIDHLRLDEFNQTHYGLLGELRWSLMPLIDFRGTLQRSNRDFVENDQSDEILALRAGVEYFRTRHLTYSASLGWYDRSSNIPELNADDIFLVAGVTYRR